jgi:hypothetical protein
MQQVQPDTVSKIQVSFVETLLYYYKVKPSDLKENPQLMEEFVQLSNLLYKIDGIVNNEVSAELNKRTRVVERNGIYFKVIEGDKKR